MSFSVTILGSSSALPTSNRYLTAHVLNANERFFLIDCGEGTQYQLRKYKAKLARINHIFITHNHGDHVFGLPGLLSSFNLLGRKSDLHIYANSQLKVILDQFFTHFLEKFAFKIIYHDLSYQSSQLIFEDSQFTVHSFPLKHRVPTCGFIFREKPKLKHIRKEMIEYYQIPIKDIFGIKNGNDFVTEEGKIIENDRLTFEADISKSYAFCSDTAYYETIVPIIKNVDLLYHEATFEEVDSKRAKETQHSTASQAAQIAKLAGAKKLVIGHFSARYKDVTVLLKEAKAVFPETDAAKEGACYNL